MPGIVQHFEQIAPGFSPIVLIGPGLAAVLLGLFLWLGGLGFRKTLVAVAGLVAGGICGFFIIGQNIISAALLAALAAVIAVIFEKIFITIITAALAATLTFAILAAPYIKAADTAAPINRDRIQNSAEPYSVAQTMEIVKAYLTDFSADIRRACSQMPTYVWAIIATAAAFFMVSGLFLWRLTSALCCAALGASLIFAGMILLLLYKGSAPLSYISARQPLYLGVFAAMTAFGTVEQLLLCPRLRRQSTGRKQTNKAKREPQETKPNWRTA